MTIEKNAITEETVDLMELEVEITTFARMMIAKVDKTEMIDPHEEVQVDEGVVVDAVVVEEERENSKGNLEMIERKYLSFIISLKNSSLYGLDTLEYGAT